MAHVPVEFGGVDGTAGLAGVVQRLIRADCGLEVVQEARTVERIELEVLRSELMLGEQRGKYENGIVAAGPGFRVIDLRQVSASG